MAYTVSQDPRSDRSASDTQFLTGFSCFVASWASAPGSVACRLRACWHGAQWRKKKASRKVRSFAS